MHIITNIPEHNPVTTSDYYNKTHQLLLTDILIGWYVNEISHPQPTKNKARLIDNKQEDANVI